MSYARYRDIHRAVGLFSAVFLLAYGVSAVQMAYPVYRPQPVERRSVVRLPVPQTQSPRLFANWLAATHGIRGDLTSVEEGPATVVLVVTRPGTVHRVTYAPGGTHVDLVTSEQGLVGMLNRLHHASGWGHQLWSVNAWGVVLVWLAVALLVLAVTGIVMWFRRHEERRAGAVVLAAGLLWGLTLLVLIRHG